MLDMDTLNWEEPHRMKVERNLNFATLPNDEDDFGFSRKKTARDPMSHRIIEKRRRDRMNNCLADLSRLVPTNYLKKGRGRIEKTEIIEMAIKHLKHLQAHPCKDPGSCEVAKATEQDHRRQFRQGYQECMSETMKFMMEVEGSWIVDGVGIRLVNHLQKHYDKLNGGLCYTQALNLMASSEDSKSGPHNMEIDNNHSSSCFPPSESNNSNDLAPLTVVPPPYCDASNPHVSNDLLKNEAIETVNHSSPSIKGSSGSQLREMLQNPGLPNKDSSSRPASGYIATSPRHMASPQHHGDILHKSSDDGCYKFKNTIKHRFNQDLRHHTASPTDSHFSSDRMSLTDEDSNKLHHHQPAEDCNNRLLGPPPGHAFTPYQAAVSELSVKIPSQHWDSHAETASSCGSNPSPPPNTSRSSGGSSSGYSTNGDKAKGGPHSPSALSPYSRTPDRLSNGSSPGPLQQNTGGGGGVPIFALHPKGTFYIPLTVEASLLIPYMVGVDDFAPVLHPISICVNLATHSVKVDKTLNRPSSSFLMDKYHDRLVCYSDSRQQLYYPCPNSPPGKNT